MPRNSENRQAVAVNNDRGRSLCAAPAPQQLGRRRVADGREGGETTVRHIHQLSSDGDTARALLSNRSFREELLRIIRQETQQPVYQ